LGCAWAGIGEGGTMGVLVGKPAPHFRAEAALGSDFVSVDLNDYKGKKYVVLFFYPLDFTFVCPTELHAFQARRNEFDKRDTVVLGASVDSKFSHHAWLGMPKEKGGIQGVKFPILSDIHRTIAKDYDVLAPEGVSYRGLFLIDKAGTVRHQVVNDL